MNSRKAYRGKYLILLQLSELVLFTHSIKIDLVLTSAKRQTFMANKEDMVSPPMEVIV